MIQLLKDYYDKKGHKYKVMSFTNGEYICESYSTGNFAVFQSNELYTTPPSKKNSFAEALASSKQQAPSKASAPKYNFNDEDTKAAIRKELEEVQAEIKKRKQSEASAEPKIQSKVEEPKIETKIEPKVEDNIKETADDFYADF